mmetsp:Transcript_21304/g.68699  ORF Transcript_21304/g.68699 Transcript_21304/m.68699 type:complete len:550 (+) Transcript_21304:140-1789(+)
MQLTLDAGRAPLDAVLSQLQALAARMPLAEASVVELPEHCGGVYDRTIPGSAGGGAAALAASAAAAPAPGGSRIVVLGAGLCALPAIELLSRRSADVVTVISAVEGEASRACAALGRPNLQPLTVDARPTNASGWGALCGLLGQADACLSLLPATMHAPVAEACIEGGTPLVTASYVSEELLALHERAVAAGVPLLGEMGLDPGLDHMSAAELIRRVREEGGAVTAFSSLCGGLPAPECASSTPLAYKFSWSPAGVISATRNPAQFTVDGAVVRVAGEELLRSATPLADSSRLGRTLRLEVLPNRDSLPYAELYGIEAEAHSVFRGTLRYAGWSGLFAEFADLGLTEPAPLPAGVRTWPELLASRGVTPTAAPAASARVIDALASLGVWDGSAPEISTDATVADAFSALLAGRLSYAPGERDAVFMEHRLHVAFPDGRPSEVRSSSLVSYGTPDGVSSMSRSVGITAALGVQRLLEQGSASSGPDAEPLAGVLRPTLPTIYEYCLPRLAEEGFAFEEGIEREASAPSTAATPMPAGRGTPGFRAASAAA